jgi:signal transduction histidine kinase
VRSPNPTGRLFRTTTFRIALAYLAFFAGSVVLLFGFVYWATAGYMAAQLDEAIESEIIGLAEQYRERGLDGLAASIRQRIAVDPGGSAVYLLADPQTRPIVGNLNRWPREATAHDEWLEFELRDRAGARGETFLARARHFTLTGGYHLLVGRDSRTIQEAQSLIVNALAWGLAITLALGLYGGVMFSRGSLLRLEDINRTSREIIAGDLARRIPTRGGNDDFDQLGQNLNAMLERIEALMSGIREVSDGIAHDLRSPLTRLRNRLETLRLRSEDEETRRLVAECTAEADQLLSTFNALLRIAEAESGRARAVFVPVDVAAVVRDAVELYEPVAHEKNQSLATEVSEGAMVLGDRHLLSQALANLLDNAIKYTPSGGRIGVSLTRQGRHVSLTVTDNGPGIPANAREKVLERFVRLDASRTTPGSGLGLALVAAVARLHAARLELADNPTGPGLCVTLTLALIAQA